MVDALYTYRSLAAEVLADSAAALTADEIWAQALARGLDQKLRSIGKTPTATIYADLQRETESSDSSFVRVGARPRRFWLRRLLASLPADAQVPVPAEPGPAPVASDAAHLSERDLHPLLAWFAAGKLGGVFVKTILHERSKKKTFGEWVHPDLVGVLFPRRALDNERAVQLAAALSAPLCKLLSFELKLSLDFSNLREAFFQAVSNSSWAHESYLVASKVSDNPEFMDELERLCEAFGVGVIELPVADPYSSRVVFAPRKRVELDWNTVDKLGDMNSDFASFLKSVSDDLKTDIHPADYDAAPADPQSYIDEKLAARRSKLRAT